MPAKGPAVPLVMDSPSRALAWAAVLARRGQRLREDEVEQLDREAVLAASMALGWHRIETARAEHVVIIGQVLRLLPEGPLPSPSEAEARLADRLGGLRLTTRAVSSTGPGVAPESVRDELLRIRGRLESILEADRRPATPGKAGAPRAAGFDFALNLSDRLRARGIAEPSALVFGLLAFGYGVDTAVRDTDELRLLWTRRMRQVRAVLKASTSDREDGPK